MLVSSVVSYLICLLAIVLTSVHLSAQANGALPPATDGGKADAPRAAKPPEALRRLESVTWNPAKCQLTWVVSTFQLEPQPPASTYVPAQRAT